MQRSFDNWVARQLTVVIQILRNVSLIKSENKYKTFIKLAYCKHFAFFCYPLPSRNY